MLAIPDSVAAGRAGPSVVKIFAKRSDSDGLQCGWNLHAKPRRASQESQNRRSEIMRLRLLPSASISPGYLALYFCSSAGLALTEKYVHGVSNFSISQSDMRKLPVFVPRLKNGTVDFAWQEKLAAKVEASSRAHEQARAKLAEAKILVEDALANV